MNIDILRESPVRASIPVDENHRLASYCVAIAVGFYLLLTMATLAAVLSKTHGTLVYALDDPYIHMAIAKNLSSHGVFGVTSHGFTSASSSIIWPLLLAVVYKLFGTSVVAPFIAQLCISIGILWLSWLIFKRSGITSSIYATCV